MRSTLTALLLVTLGGATLGCATTQEAEPKKTSLADEYWELMMQTSPTWATSVGDHRYDDQIGDSGPEARATLRAALVELRDRVRVSTDDSEVTRALLLLQLEDSIAADDAGLGELAVDQMSGPQAWMPYFFSVEHPMTTTEDAENLLARYRALPKYLDGLVADLEAGLASGRVAPKILVERVIKQLETLLSAEDNVFVRAAERAEDPALKAQLVAAANTEVRGGFQRYTDFLRDTYLPKSRASIGLGEMPGGKEAYAYLARHHTTTKLSPEEIHQIGLDEMARIETKLRELAKERGFVGEPWDFVRGLKNDPKFRAKSRDELLASFGDALKRADAKLPEAFGRLPKLAYEVKAMDAEREKDAPAAYYQPGSVKDGRMGIFVANLYRFEERPTFNSEVLAFHEAVPGHHLQIAIAQELGDLPAFRREMGVTAFVEGWGLYSEQLADELGLYGSLEARVGYLGYRAWRASRLVVDTGMHALGWSRESAIEYLAGHTTLGTIDVENEIDRYIAMPGQALAYMIGCLRINAIRDRAKREQGDKFDIRAFHDALLGQGALPLDVLELHVADELQLASH